MKHLILNHTLRRLSLFFAFLCAFVSHSSADEEYDEDLDEEVNLFCYSRYAFPTTCEQHFSTNIGIKRTWMKADHSEAINSFADYLHIIPKIYVADCAHCYDCNGVKFNLYRGCDFPTDDVDAFHELQKGHVQSKVGYGKYCTHDSDHCESLCWNGGYFRFWNQKYLHFFKHYLQYCSENNDCPCYWPECDQSATSINNRVYEILKDLADEGLITRKLSPYWRARKIEFDQNGKIYTEVYYPNSHGHSKTGTHIIPVLPPEVL